MDVGKMKSLFYFLCLFAIISCSGDDEDIVTTIVGKGGFARLVSLDSDEFDLKELETSAFIYEVEFVTIDKGANVDVYEIYVGFNGGDSLLIRSFSQSDFATNSNGYKSVQVNINLFDIADILDFDVNNLITGDYFKFDGFVVLTDGSRYGNDNIKNNTNITARDGFMRTIITMKCPLGETNYVGTYEVTYVNPVNAPNCLADIPTLTENIPNFFLTNEGSSTVRKIEPDGGEIPWATSGFSYNGTSELEFVCDSVQMTIPFKLDNDCGGGIEL